MKRNCICDVLLLLHTIIFTFALLFINTSWCRSSIEGTNIYIYSNRPIDFKRSPISGDANHISLWLEGKAENVYWNRLIVRLNNLNKSDVLFWRHHVYENLTKLQQNIIMFQRTCYASNCVILIIKYNIEENIKFNNGRNYEKTTKYFF